MAGIPKEFAELLRRPWRAQSETPAGSWCVTLAEDPRTPAEGALPIAMFISRELATHIADVHNRSLEVPVTSAPQIGEQRRAQPNVPVEDVRSREQDRDPAATRRDA